MGKIKVIVKSVETANQMIDFWKEIDVAIEIVIDEKENITTANSDVKVNFKRPDGELQPHSQSLPPPLFYK